MTLKPCVECGELSEHLRCSDHALPDTRDTITTRKHHPLEEPVGPSAEYVAVLRVLRSVDHILPVDEFRHLAFTVENLRVLCLACNGLRGKAYAPNTECSSRAIDGRTNHHPSRAALIPPRVK